MNIKVSVKNASYVFVCVCVDSVGRVQKHINFNHVQCSQLYTEYFPFCTVSHSFRQQTKSYPK